MALLRKVVFYFLVLVFFILAPLIILYALGYLFKPGQATGVIKTGLVYISTVPKGASIHLESKRYARTTPAMVRDLLPGDYSLKLAAKGYKTWSGKIPIRAGRATALDKLILIPEAWKHERISRDTFHQLIPVPEADLFFLSKGKQLDEIFVYFIQEKILAPLFPKSSPVPPNAQILSLYTERGSPYLLLLVKTEEGEKFLWARPDPRKSAVEDLTNLFLEIPEKVVWDPEVPSHPFALQGGELYRLDIALKTVYPKFLEGVQGYGFFDRSLYAVTKDGVFLRTDVQERKIESLHKDPELFRSLFGKGGSYEIRILSDDAILFLGDNGRLISNQQPYRLSEEGILGAEYNARAEKLLLWKKDRIGVLDFSSEGKEEAFFERRPEVQWIFEDGKVIAQAFWVYKGSHVLFRDGNEAYLLKLGIDKKEVPRLVTAVKEDSALYYSEDRGKLYYLHPSSKNLFTVTIVPRQELIVIPFVELERNQVKRDED